MRIKSEVEIDLFSDQSCIVFITLLKPLGYIKRTTTTFKKLFGQTAEEVVDKSCNIIMPENIGKHHDRFLDWFLQNDRMSSLKKGEIFNFGVRSNGFIFSLQKRLRLDTFEDDFGVSAYLMETNKTFEYILIDEENYVREMTENLFIYCF